MFSIEKMFKKLGYFKIIDEYYIYFNKYDKNGFMITIEFDLVNKSFSKYLDDNDDIYVESISSKELIVINNLCILLGWI